MSTGPVRVVLLGRLADAAGPHIEIALGEAEAFEVFAARLPERVREELSCGRIRIAINAALVDPAAATIHPGDELALLPPVSGG